jgi:prepilin-type N-terminal cleavage/methylation domain-containing protein
VEVALTKDVRTRDREDGFTLAEVLIALVLVAITTIGVAPLIALAALSARTSHSRTWSCLLAASKLDELKTLSLAFDASGGPLTDTTTDASADPLRAGGTGLGPSPPDSLDRNVPGYVDYLDGTGQWVGAGATRPASAVYVRRWNIAPLPGDPANTVLIRIVVVPVVSGVAPGSKVVSTNQSGSPVLVAIKTRKAA